MSDRLVLSIDQGTTGSTCLVLDTRGVTRGRATREFTQHFPSPGLVEHEPDELWESVDAAAREAMRQAGVSADAIACVGITNQRETTVLWDRETGRAVHRAIVWQDRRTAPRCEALRARGHEPRVRAVTGLVLDPYFSGTKLGWLLDEVPGARERAERGALAFGTIDSFLLHRLTRGATHRTDVTNASRTLLMSLETLDWSDEMLALLGVPRALLPTIVPSAGPIAEARGVGFVADGTPITGIAGDQQAALFGQGCLDTGDVKCTYGTGAFVLVNTGETPVPSRAGLLTTVGWKIGDRVRFALEGSAFVAGALVQWLRDGLGLIERASDVEALARKVPDTGGVTLVPALAGLGAPYWDPGARGLVTGLTRGTTAAHLARAALEGIAFEVTDLLLAMKDDLGAPLARMRVDGGAAGNDLLMQLQADLGALTVERPAELESTAKGAAMLAAVGAGLFADERAAVVMNRTASTFSPRIDDEARAVSLARWSDAVRRARS
jgi:glycerol kinase